MELKKIVSYLDNYLEIDAFHDDSANGLQIENSGHIKQIGLAVDANLAATLKAAKEECNLLIVHHGLFWGKQQLVTDNHFQRIRALIQADIALYAAHLPLDAHQEVGHNITIAQKLGLNNIEPFALYYSKPIGMKGKLPTPKPFQKIVAVLEKVFGQARGFLQFGSEKIESIGVVAGSATEPQLFKELKAQNIDLFVTGEPKHGAYHLAQEFGLNIFYGHHYVTETFGMKALGIHLQKQLHIPTIFIDTPCIF